MNEKVSRSRKQTELKMTVIKTVYSSSQRGSSSAVVVMVVVGGAWRAELSVGDGGLMETRRVAFCILVGGCLHPAACV